MFDLDEYEGAGFLNLERAVMLASDEGMYCALTKLNENVQYSLS